MQLFFSLLLQNSSGSFAQHYAAKKTKGKTKHKQSNVYSMYSSLMLHGADLKQNLDKYLLYVLLFFLIARKR